MTASQTAKNPFYALLVVVGVLFVLTACAYLVMTLHEREPRIGAPAHRLVELLDRYGLVALLVELGLLAVATVAAIATDEHWSRRTLREQQAVESSSGTGSTREPPPPDGIS